MFCTGLKVREKVWIHYSRFHIYNQILLVSYIDRNPKSREKRKESLLSAVEH